MGDDFYVRYYVGHKGKFGHEFLEFELRPDGRLRYANNSNYKNDTMIRKEGARKLSRRSPPYDRVRRHPTPTPHPSHPRPHLRPPPRPASPPSPHTWHPSPMCAVFVNEGVLAEVKRIIDESEIVREDDKQWPEPDRNGRQEFEVVSGQRVVRPDGAARAAEGACAYNACAARIPRVRTSGSRR